MNATQSRMKVFEIIDKHMSRKGGCEHCVSAIAGALYHAQSDPSVRELIDSLMDEGGFNKEGRMGESSATFNDNMEKIKQGRSMQDIAHEDALREEIKENENDKKD